MDVPGDPTQDDAFASLFRPETPAAPEARIEQEAVSSPAQTPAPPTPVTSTGRLFRSSAANGDTDAIPALRSDQARRLRTVGAAASSEPPRVVISSTAAAPAITPEAMPMPAAAEPGNARRAAKEPRESKAPRTARPAGPGLPGGLAVLLVVVVSLVAGLIDVLIGAGLGWIWGVGMVVSSAYAAFATRSGDGTYAVTAPPIAALVSVVTVAQFNLGASGGSLFDRAVVAFFALGDHWTWIIGSTLLALVIVLVRSRTRRA